jgi:hypothetical protein
MAITIGLLLGFASNGQSTMDTLPKIANVSTYNFNRHYQVWIWMYWSNCHMDLLNQGFVTGRYGIMGSDLFYWLAGSWYLEAQEINLYTN